MFKHNDTQFKNNGVFYAPLIYFLYLYIIKRTPILIYPIYKRTILFQPMHAFIRKYI